MADALFHSAGMDSSAGAPMNQVKSPMRRWSPLSVVRVRTAAVSSALASSVASDVVARPAKVEARAGKALLPDGVYTGPRREGVCENSFVPLSDDFHKIRRQATASSTSVTLMAARQVSDELDKPFFDLDVTDSQHAIALAA